MTDRPPTEAALDADFLARQTFGDRELGRELLLLLAEQCERLRPALEGSGPRGADAAHTLKGAARAVGAERLAGAAERLETALGRGDARPEALLVDLDAAVRDTRAAVRRWMDAA